MEDPKKQNGDKKDPMQLLPTEPLRKMARVMGLGRDKYGEYNWRHSDGVEAMTYVGAIRRHLDQFIDGEDVDAESGESHLAHIMATCAILIDAERVGNLRDNRPALPAVAAAPGGADTPQHVVLRDEPLPLPATWPCNNLTCAERSGDTCTMGATARDCSGRMPPGK